MAETWEQELFQQMSEASFSEPEPARHYRRIPGTTCRGPEVPREDVELPRMTDAQLRQCLRVMAASVEQRLQAIEQQNQASISALRDRVEAIAKHVGIGPEGLR